jgi:hypothetical protein
MSVIIIIIIIRPFKTITGLHLTSQRTDFV